MSSKGNVRSSSHGRKHSAPHTRPVKPTLTRRGTSFHAHHHLQSPSSATKAGSGWSKKVGTTGNQLGEEDDMASFLQFCATCEKQIFTPSSSLLYCSEACRRRDTLTTTAISAPLSPLMTASTHPTLDTRPADIIPQLSPTVLRPVSLTFSDLTISESGSPTDDIQPFYLRHDSDSTSYLEQFHSNTWSTGSNLPPQIRPTQCNTATDSSTIPSLSHTPSSSVGTVASMHPVRPLPSRHNPSYSSFAAKPLDLAPAHPISDISVSPTQLCKDASLKSCASTLTAFRVAEAGEMSYDHRRQASNRRDSSAQASLRQLFSHDAIMKAPPA